MPKYRIGVRAHDYGKLRPEQLMEAIAKDGWEGVQLAMPKAIAGVESFGEVDADITEKVRRAAERYGERIFVLGVYVDLGQADEIMRKAAVKTFLSQLSCAKALGAACIGSETTNWMQQPAGTTRQQGLRQVIRSMEEILPEADRLGVTVALEAGYEHTMNTPEAVKEILASLPGNHIRMIFDPGNLLGPEWMDQQEKLFAQAMEAYGDKILVVHAKGMRIAKDGRRTACPFSAGEIDYAAIRRVMRDLPQEEILVTREERCPP
jgi:L-ribulose-5-phosphate 3-epimerase